MRFSIAVALAVLFSLFGLGGCSNSSLSAQKRADVNSSMAVTRLCYRNEYPFEDDPDHKDVELLTLELRGDRAAGEYDWLPAFKDQRRGRFEGSFDGQSVSAIYEYTQEGQSASVAISIRLAPGRAVVAGGSPGLGLNVTLALVDC